MDREVKDPVRSHAPEERRDRVDVCEVRLVPRDVRADLLEPPRIVSRADESRHGHPVGQQSPHEIGADEPRGAGQQRARQTMLR